MKKLMFAAALAATASAFATVYEDAQVYQVRVAARTTQAIAAKEITTNENPFVTANLKDDAAIYRDTTQYVLNGLIWGCSCETILGNYAPQTDLGGGTNAFNGAMFWIPKTMTYVIGTDQGGNLGWQFINAIGKTGNKCEGYFSLWVPGGCANTTWGNLNFAGFGTLGRTNAAKNTASVSNCTYYVQNISGNFAGSLPAPTYNTSDIDDCPYCTEKTPGACKDSTAWEWCKCATTAQPQFTAAYGEWYIRYNATMSAALKTSKHIGQVYDFGGRSDKNDVWKNYVKRFIKKVN